MAGRFRRATAKWAAQFWADLKASTDAGLLGILRFLGLLYGPIDARLPIDQAFRKSLGYRLAPHVGWRHALGGITYLLFIILVITGVLLSVHYRPSAQEAYPSLQHIVSGVTLGWLIRDLHVWSASLLVLAVLAHMARVFFDAAYKPPRETNWLVGVLLLFLVLAFGASGYLLPWDQWAYWTVTEALNALATVPLVGGAAVAVLRGDPIVSGATLSRFFAMHVIVLPWITLALVAFHFTMVRRHGVAPLRNATAEPGRGRVFFPSHLLRSFMVAVVTCAVVISAAALWPRPVGEPADPAKLPEIVRSTWVVVDVSRALTHYLGAWGFVGFTLVALGLAFVPLFDRGPERDLRRRPAVAILGLVFFVGFVAAWMAGRQLRSGPPPEALPAASEASTPPPAAGAPLPELGPTPTRAAPPADTTRAGGPR
ncbi:MAG TPA: cytochrome b N-terminal domain-containing protein [Gemmatimonadales bacterium]|nr:cytochrome b N-terminal domain-containing protein [Gemmatimonadales bacterium]